ncbi:hypothetical protein TeGR_g2496 [Tetraparma gracilis]|uniref:START domain-containing protein n=1 Tax=Tetraparma gracilis TaxID=2962635 RepID=A0ABQ6N109_9STRA|nr:hypothetical protein TeGR_g2496 [Tetraparma gracilis]
MSLPPLPSPAVPTPPALFQSSPLFSSAHPSHTSQYLVTAYRKQHLPTTLVHSVTTSIHTSAAALLHLLALHLESALAGRLPQDLLPSVSGDRKLLAGSAAFAQTVKFSRLTKRQFRHDLRLREVAHDAYSAVEFQQDPSAPLPPHALRGTFVLVPGPHGTTTVQAVAAVDVAAAPEPDAGARPSRGAKASTASSTAQGTTALDRTSTGLPLPPDEGRVLLDDFLLLIPKLFGMFDRSSEVDEATRETLAEYFTTTTTVASEEENELIDEVVGYEEQDWERISGTVQEPVEYFQVLAKGKSMLSNFGRTKSSAGSNSDDEVEGAWGKATTNVDTSADRCLAYYWHHMSYVGNTRFEKNNGRLLKMQVDVPNSHSTFMVTSGKSPFPGVDDRVLAARWAWRREKNGDFVAGFTYKGSSELVERVIKEDERAVGCTQGTIQGFWWFTPLAANVCRATFVFQTTVGGRVPVLAMNFGVKRALVTIEELRDKYERNGKAVDAELRAEFPSPPRVSELSPAQEQVVKSCQRLEAASADVSWSPLKSPSTLVSMWSKPPTSFERGERNITIGKAECDLDAAAKDAQAWWLAFCSRDRMRINKEEKNPARLTVKESANENVVATVKSAPFPFNRREFVAMQVCASDNSNDDLLFAAESVGESVDYGTSLKAVRGKTRLFVRLRSVSPNSCTLTYFQYVDVGGLVPARVLSYQLRGAFGVVEEVRQVFDRSDEVDKLARDELAGSIEHEQQVYDEGEEALISSVQDKLGGLKEEDFKELESPDHLVKMQKAFRAGSSSVVLRGSATLDASLEECAAHELLKISRARAAINKEDEETLTWINSHHGVFRFILGLGAPGFDAREWILEHVWRKEGEDALATYYEHIPLHPHFHDSESTYAKGNSSEVIFRYERLPPLAGGIPQTRLTYTQQVDLGGAIPKSVVNNKGPERLMVVSRARMQFDKSPVIDAASILRLVTMIQSHDGDYSEREEEIMEEGQKMLGVFEQQKSKKLEMATPTTQAKMAFKDGQSHAYGWSTAVVRASPAQVLAYTWDFTKRSSIYEDDLEKTVDEDGEHNKLTYIKKKIPDPFSNRDFHTRSVWRKRGEGYTLVSAPELGDTHPITSDVVRGKYPSMLIISSTSNGFVKLEYVIQPEISGSVPLWLALSGMGSSLAYVTEIQDYFQALRGLEIWRYEDGEAIGEVLVTKTDAEKQHGKGETRAEARVRAMMEKQKGLKELGQKHEWFEALLAKVVANKLRPAGDSKAKLCNMSAKEANVIGGALASCIAANLTAPAAVDEWILRYPAMGELEQEYVWFRPMMDTIAQRLLESVSWGLKMRLYTGAGLSTMDLLSDLYMIYTYATTNQRGAALSLATMVGLCLLLQLLGVLMNARKAPKKVILREMLIVLSGMKPGIDAMRVADGNEQAAHAAISPDAELVVTRGVEMAMESIPGSILQVKTLMQAETFSKVALASIIVSALTTGFSAATISFDFDVSPQRRRDEPDFYGYIPDAASSRTLIFGCMIVNGALLLLVRSVSMALLAIVGGQWVLVYLVSDMGLYFTYKILRRDLWHWMPLEGAASVVESVLERLIAKVLVDFTGVLQFRGAGELGGCYFTFNMIMSLAASFVATHVYYASLVEDRDAVMNESVAWTIVWGLSGLWTFFQVCFLLLMKPAYRSTFFSTQSGHAWVKEKFVKGDTDELKSWTLGCNKKQWLPIRDDMKAWTLENWERWEDEQPEWFNDAFRSSVDDDMIPAESLARLKGGGERRRSSLGDVLGGSNRKVLPVGGSEN